VRRTIGRYWRTGSRQRPSGSGEALVLRGHEDVVYEATFSPDGQRIVTALGDHTVRVQPVTIPELQRLLRETTTDCLPPELRQTYLDESESQAQERYEACERSYGREPLFKAAP
jgi:hypothetical protein